MWASVAERTNIRFDHVHVDRVEEMGDVAVIEARTDEPSRC